jgi:hypothetical protein
VESLQSVTKVGEGDAIPFTWTTTPPVLVPSRTDPPSWSVYLGTPPSLWNSKRVRAAIIFLRSVRAEFLGFWLLYMGTELMGGVGGPFGVGLGLLYGFFASFEHG